MRPIEDTLREALSYDAESGELRWKEDWWPKSTANRVAGHVASTKNGRTKYRRIEHRRKAFPAHRVAWLLYYGEWPKREIDHIDGDGLNNKIENLRLADRRQNSFNRPKYKNNKSGFKGVQARACGRFYAHIGFEGKLIHIGTYLTAESAARAYDEKARELHGPFARLNYPDP